MEQVAVFGISDDYYGEVPAAALVAMEGMDFTSLEMLGKEALAAYKVPRIWFLVDQLPMTPSGKIRKLALRELAETGKIEVSYNSDRRCESPT